MKLCPMQIEDFHQIQQLWLSTAGMGLNDIDDSYDGIKRYLMRNPNTCFVAKEKDEIIGTILCGHDGRRGYIYHTTIKKEKQHQGIATALVTQALEALKTEGICKVALVAFNDNRNGNAFWERLGFTKREDLTYRNKALQQLTVIIPKE